MSRTRMTVKNLFTKKDKDIIKNTLMAYIKNHYGTVINFARSIHKKDTSIPVSVIRAFVYKVNSCAEFTNFKLLMKILNWIGFSLNTLEYSKDPNNIIYYFTKNPEFQKFIFQLYDNDECRFLSYKIKQERKKQGISIRKMATLLDINQSQYELQESFRIRHNYDAPQKRDIYYHFSIQNVAKIINFLKIPLEKLMDGYDEYKKTMDNKPPQIQTPSKPNNNISSSLNWEDLKQRFKAIGIDIRIIDHEIGEITLFIQFDKINKKALELPFSIGTMYSYTCPKDQEEQLYNFVVDMIDYVAEEARTNLFQKLNMISSNVNK